MELQYLTGENIARAQSLFDLMVLAWRELHAHEGEIHTAQAALPDDELVAASVTRSISDAIDETWSTNPTAAGEKLIDHRVRDAFTAALGLADPSRTLLPMLLLIEERCADIMLRRQRVLNREFTELGSVYLNPVQSLRSFMVDPADLPGGFGEWPPAQLTDFSIILPTDHDYRYEFVDLPSLAVGRAPDGPLVFAVAEHCNDGDVLRWRAIRESKARKHCHVWLECSVDAEDRMVRVIEMMNEQGVHVGVLPELSMTERLLETAQETMARIHHERRGQNSLRLLVAGSMHHPAGAKHVVNASHVLGRDGTPLWVQPKNTPYAWPEGEPTHEEALDVRERVVYVCDLWFGRTVVTICLDYLVEHVRTLASALNVGCFLVPAMTPKTRDFAKSAHDNIRIAHAGTFVSNAFRQAVAIDPDAAASLACPPVRGAPDRTVRYAPLEQGPTVTCFEIS